MVRFAVGHHDPVVHRRRHAMSGSFAVVVLAWSFVRTAVVWAMVGGYGLNPWLYLLLDLSSASVAAIATPRMVFHFVDDRLRRAAWWAGFNLAAFLLPDAYLFLGTRRLPLPLVLMVCTMVGVALVVTVLGLRRRVRAVRLRSVRVDGAVPVAAGT